MDFGRRDFLKLGVAGAVLSTVPKPALAEGKEPIRQTQPSILQGATDSSKTQFSIVHESSQKLEFTVTNASGQTWTPDRIEVKTWPGHAKAVTRLFFSNLYPNEIFFLNLIDTESKVSVDQREFKVLDFSKEKFRFAIASCMNYANHEPGIWQDMLRREPEVIFFIGDSVYCDFHSDSVGGANPAQLWHYFTEARSILEIYFSKRLVPILAVWDDHDFGKNDATSTFPYSKESLENFTTFFAQEESHCSVLTRGPGVSLAFQRGSQLFIMLDDRTHRLPSGSQDRYAHWGSEQESWLLDLISKHQGPTYLMNGTQFFPSMPFKQSVSANHSAQLDGLVQELKKLSSKVIFVSGDVHYSEISGLEPELLGYASLELTSSAIHSNHFPGFPMFSFNDRRLASSGEKNYLMVESEANGLGANLKVASRSSQDSINFKMKFQI